MTKIDSIQAWTIEPGDFIVIDGDDCEVREVLDVPADDPDYDLDLVRVKVFNHASNMVEPMDLYADDSFDVWGE